MATLELTDQELVVRLRPMEKIGALHGDLHVPRSAVRAVEPVEQPFSRVRGLRAPGTEIPRVINLGTWRQRHGVKDFVAVYRHRPGVVIELDRAQARYQRLVLSTPSTSAAEDLRSQLTPG